MGKKAIFIEAGQNSHAWEAMTDSGDATTFEASFNPISRANGNPSVAPYGVLTGLEVSVDSASDDSVAVSAGTVMAPGMTGADSDGKVSISADSSLTVSRPTTNDYQILSITVDSTGSLAVVEGTEDASAHSETRGASGGPPYIPVGSIEIAQVRYTSTTSAVVLASEIKQVPGSHREMSANPVWSVDYANGEVTFSQALDLIHTGDVAKKVYIKGESPELARLGYATDWQPPLQSHSVQSTDTYDGAVGNSQSSLNQGSFTVLGDDGISDQVAQLKNQNLWCKYLPNDDASYPYQLAQGLLGISWTSPAGTGKVSISCTLSADTEATDILSA